MRLLFCLALFVAPIIGLAQSRPNVVILLVDDGGFMDFGGYGGEAATPNINRIADQGVRFSNYHTSPLCAPSRAMLLTGLDNHRTGVGTIPEVITDAQEGEKAYALSLLPEVDTIADRLKAAGYQTFMTGKWHLGRAEGDLPNHHGFDRSFTLDASGADNWEQRSYMPYYDEAPWFEDGAPATLPEDFYSSRFFIEKLIEYLEARDRSKPFFSYVGFQAIHIPIQAPQAFIDRYEGVFSDGWDLLRDQRFERAKALGLVPENAAPPVPHPSLRSWESLSEEEKQHYETSMMVNAGMIEAMDHYIGQLVDYLETEGELDNTVFVITSDNGPEFNDPSTNAAFMQWASQNDYHIDMEQPGGIGYLGAIGTEWASAAAVPGSLYKMYATEGGTRVPMMISGPGVPRVEGFNSALNFVIDVAPTIAEMAGVESQGMDGRSLLPLLTGDAESVYGAEDEIGLEVAGNAALFKGDFKLTRNTRPHGDFVWRLFNVRVDPAESSDLSGEMPELKAEMLAAYKAFEVEYGVVAVPEEFNIVDQIRSNTAAVVFKRNLSTILLSAFGFLLVLVAAMLFIRRRRSN
ncbi:MAG: arylsulfatase [Pseudomonadales bacterium]|nr:arylsulfatase [Pseudomonadales bacterium]MBO7005604.1 arylsulfatase [Pseudomonadales bacterium]